MTRNDEDQPEEIVDPRAAEVVLEACYVDIPDSELTTIMGIAHKVYCDLVLSPTRNTWRKDEGSRRELEREFERTAMRDMAESIKREVDAKLGGCWHVVYGRDYGTYVTHKRLCFCQFQLEGANVVVWRHGG